MEVTVELIKKKMKKFLKESIKRLRILLKENPGDSRIKMK